MELRRIELLSENKSTQLSPGAVSEYNSLRKNLANRANAQVGSLFMTGYESITDARSPLTMMPHAGAVVLTRGDKGRDQAAIAKS